MTRRVLTAGALLLGVLLVILFFTTEWMASRPPADDTVAGLEPVTPSRRPDPRVAGKTVPTKAPKPSSSPERHIQVDLTLLPADPDEKRPPAVQTVVPTGVDGDGSAAMLRRGIGRNEFIDDSLRTVVQANAPVTLVAFHPGKPSLLAAATCLLETPDKKKLGNDVVILEADTGKVIAKMAVQEYGQGTITADPQKELPPLTKSGYSGPWRHFWRIRSIVFHPSEDLLALGTFDGYLVLWTPGSEAAPVRLAGFPHPMDAIAFHPDGNLIAIAGRSIDGMLQMVVRENSQWRLGEVYALPQALSSTYVADTGVLHVAAFTGFWTQDNPAAAPALKRSLSFSDRLVSASLAPKASLFAAGWPGELKVIDLLTGAPRKDFGSLSDFPNGIVALDTDGGQIAFGTDTSKEWRTGVNRSPELILKEAQQKKPRVLMKMGSEYEVSSLAFSRDGKTLASGHGNGSILVWRIDDVPSK